MKAVLCRKALLLAGLALAGPAAASATPRATLPLRYATTCPPPGDPSAITVKDSPKGPVVTFERADLGKLDTRDDNLAFVSRRFFFKLRTDTELIEFQGRAQDRELEGLLSDAHGARHIVILALPDGAAPTCGAMP